MTTHPSNASASQRARSVGDTTTQQAEEVGRSAQEASQDVTTTTKEQASQVTHEATRQARDLLEEARREAVHLAEEQRERLVQTLNSLNSDLSAMANQGDQNGLATELVRQTTTRTHDLANYLERHQLNELVDQAREFARRRPGAFLLGAVIAGLGVGRMTRSGASASRSSEPSPPLPEPRSSTSPELAEPVGPDTGAGGPHPVGSRNEPNLGRGGTT